MVREAELHQAAGGDDVGYGLAGPEVRGVGCVQRAHAVFGWLPVLGWAGCAVGRLWVGLTVGVSMLGCSRCVVAVLTLMRPPRIRPMRSAGTGQACATRLGEGRRSASARCAEGRRCRS